MGVTHDSVELRMEWSDQWDVTHMEFLGHYRPEEDEQPASVWMLKCVGLTRIPEEPYTSTRTKTLFGLVGKWVLQNQVVPQDWNRSVTLEGKSTTDNVSLGTEHHVLLMGQASISVTLSDCPWCVGHQSAQSHNGRWEVESWNLSAGTKASEYLLGLD